jgi:hypothetical protein
VSANRADVNAVKIWSLRNKADKLARIGHDAIRLSQDLRTRDNWQFCDELREKGISISRKAYLMRQTAIYLGQPALLFPDRKPAAMKVMVAA